MRRQKLCRTLARRHSVAPPRAVIDAVITPLAERVTGHRPLGMIGHAGDTGREKRLVALVDSHGRVGPPEKRLSQRRAIGDANLQFHPRMAGPEADAVHAFEPRKRIMITQPNGLGAVGIFLDGVIDRQKRRRTVVLRPVELDAARHPRSGQSNKRRFDHRLPVNQVVAVRFVLHDVNASADLGQDHHAQNSFSSQMACQARSVLVSEMRSVKGSG